MAEHEDPAPESVSEQLRIFRETLDKEKSTKGTLLWKCHHYEEIPPVTTHAGVVALIDDLLNIYDRWPPEGPLPPGLKRWDPYDQARRHLRSRAKRGDGNFEADHTWGQPLVAWEHFPDAPSLAGDAKAAIDELRIWAVKKAARPPSTRRTATKRPAHNKGTKTAKTKRIEKLIKKGHSNNEIDHMVPDTNPGAIGQIRHRMKLSGRLKNDKQ